MEKSSTLYVELDVHKDIIDIATVDAWRARFDTLSASAEISSGWTRHFAG